MSNLLEPDTFEALLAEHLARGPTSDQQQKAAKETIQVGGRRAGVNTINTAIRHLHAILNSRLNASQMLAAEKEARDWLASIGSEPP